MEKLENMETRLNEIYRELDGFWHLLDELEKKVKRPKEMKELTRVKTLIDTASNSCFKASPQIFGLKSIGETTQGH